MRGTPKIFAGKQDFANCFSLSDNEILEDAANKLYSITDSEVLIRLGFSGSDKTDMLSPVAMALQAVGKYVGYNIICEGDSLFGSYGMPAKLNGKLHLGDGSLVSNVGLGGDTVALMIGEAATQVDPLYSATWYKNIAILEGGINDLGTGACDEVALYANMVTWCQARQAAGFQVIICTITPRSGDSQEAKRLWVNAQIRANWEDFCDGVCDIGADPIMGDHANTTDVAWFRDGVHPTDAGFEIFAQIIANSIAEI